MKLKIIEPLNQKEAEVVWIEINTPDGNFVIQSEHAETTFVLCPNKEFIYCFKTGKQETLTFEKGGILEVTKEVTTLLIG